MKAVIKALRSGIVCFAAALLLAPAAGIAQIGPADIYDLSLVDEAFENESAQYDGVDVFVERLAGPAMFLAGMAGMDLGCAQCIFSKIEQIALPGGGLMFVSYIMSMLEVYELGGIGMSAGMMEAMGSGMMMGQFLMNAGVGEVVPNVGPDYMNPTMLFSLGGEMMNEGADARRDAAASLANANQTAQDEANRTANIRSLLRNTGQAEGPIGTMTCFRADGLDMPMEAGEGQTARMNAAGLCVDNDEHVIVQHRFEGTMVGDDGAREFFIEVELSDFRHVDGCNLYKPYRRVNRMGGMLNDAEMAEMEEARQQLEEFEAQLAAMPPAQRAMMESMMGGQMDMVRNMANGGAIEHVQEIEEIICNPDLKALLSPVDPAFELAQIQRDLVTLGYTPGNTDGVMDVLTEVAISQYQAERGLPVTGQPSTDLALMLSSEVAGQ